MTEANLALLLRLRGLEPDAPHTPEGMQSLPRKLFSKNPGALDKPSFRRPLGEAAQTPQRRDHLYSAATFVHLGKIPDAATAGWRIVTIELRFGFGIMTA